MDFEQQIADVVLDTMCRLDARTSSEVYRDGLLNVLDQPECARSAGPVQLQGPVAAPARFRQHHGNIGGHPGLDLRVADAPREHGQEPGDRVSSPTAPRQCLPKLPHTDPIAPTPDRLVRAGS